MEPHPRFRHMARLAMCSLTTGLVLWGALHPTVAQGAENGWSLWRWDNRWVAADQSPAANEKGAIVFERRGGKRACLSRAFDVNLDQTPTLEIAAGPSHAHWRLTGQIGSQPELVLADFQTEGTCRRDVARRLFACGKQRVTLRFVMWGWGGPEIQRLVVERVAFAPRRAECDADGMSGVMLQRHQRAMTRAKGIRPVKHEHPALRYRNSQKTELRKKARTTHRIFARRELDIIGNLEEERAKPPYVLGPGLLRKTPHAWRGGVVQLRPPQPPALKPGEGWDPFVHGRRETVWRTLCWHDFSRWVIGSALTDDPAFARQAQRWITAMARWHFWKRPDYVYFDFNTSYPLQNFAYGYDIAFHLMTEAERTDVREAMAQLARGLYLNTLTGHGTIYNDLRGNHTAVTLCGLGLAGLAMLNEHPEAPRWVALAEQLMLDAFEEHTSGAWTESPSYGNYGVNEWLKFAEALRNVTGRDHLRHPFLKRYGDYQLMICDWEGRNLGYNGGGCGQRWNHWIFFYIANQRRWPEMQWLANFCIQGVESFGGYGDPFWWADPTLEAKRPTGRNVGRHYADVGVSVWRSGWQDDPTILLHHCGRKGQHKEENMNHFTLYVKGRCILPDGLGGKTADHNVPMIVGRKQNKWGPGATLTFHSDERSGYSLGDATKAYGRKTLRHMLYLRTGVLAVVDDITLSTKREEGLAFALHPNGQTQIAGGSFRVVAGDVTLVGMFADAKGSTLRPVATARKRTKRATHDVVASSKGRGSTRTITLLRFGKTAELPATSLRVERRNGWLDFVCGSERLRVGTKPGAIAEGYSTNAALWLAQIVNEKPAVVLATAGKKTAPLWISAEATRMEGNGCVSWKR